MKSQRLNNVMKQSILERALTSAFGAAEEQSVITGAALAELILKYVVSKYMDSAAFQALGTDILGVKSKDVNFATNSGSYRSLKLLEAKHIPHTLQYRHSHKYCLKTCKHEKEVLVHLAANDKRTNEKRELRKKLKVLLDSFTTTKHLLAVWPEGKQFLPKLESSGTAMPPAVNMEEIRRYFPTEPKTR